MFSDVTKRNIKHETTEIDVREDEEQAFKLEEILKMLVFAGYYRARIKGISNFDKIVGGMTWCIESCCFDVDVDLLFQENLSIGQKIALTEKIVIMLPKMNCPHRIEPHQMQGLDFIHIFPVMQWLVMESMKTRKVMEHHVRSFAIHQFDKKYIFVKPLKAAQIKNYNTIQNINLVMNKVEQLMKDLSKFDDKNNKMSLHVISKIVNIQAEEISETIKKSVNLSTTYFEKKGGSCKQTIVSLEKQKLLLDRRLKEISKDKGEFYTKLLMITHESIQIQKEMTLIDRVFEKIKYIKQCESGRYFEILEKLLILIDGLKNQDIKYRDQCRFDLDMFNNMVENMKIKTPLAKTDRVIKYEKQKDIINHLKLQLAKKSRVIATLTRQLDDVPGRSELTQYQRRFMELYNQVSVKHKETKQFYTLYNTLDDKKLYASKELSLLNSIQDNYNEAMISSNTREQFIKQFEFIIDGVKRNKVKVENRYTEEKDRRDALILQHSILMEQQRKYVTAVRQLTVECRKNETLLARLRGT